jgi:peroxiredoxin
MKLTALILIGCLTLFAADEYSNRRAPGFSLYDSHFVQHDPQDYRGKVLILDFMLTTCPVCNKLGNSLLLLKTKYGDKIAVMSILTLPDTFDTVNQFAAQNHIPWPMLFDSGQVMMSYLKVTPTNPKVDFPHLFIIDGSGTIRYDFEGNEDLDAIAMKIDSLLK